MNFNSNAQVNKTNALLLATEHDQLDRVVCALLDHMDCSSHLDLQNIVCLSPAKHNYVGSSTPPSIGGGYCSSDCMQEKQSSTG